MTPKPQENKLPLTSSDNNPASRQIPIVENVVAGYMNGGFIDDDKSASRNECPLHGIPAKNNLQLKNVDLNDMKNPEKSSSSGVDKPIIDFDDLLPYIGEFGKYQKCLFLCMIPFAFFIAFVYFSQIFMTVVPEEHWCNVPELEHLPLEERLALSIPLLPLSSVGKRNGAMPEHHQHHEYSKCTMYNVNYTEILQQGIKTADPKWPVTSCRNGWNYNFTDIPYATVATDLGWVCENSALPTIAQSIFFIGAIVGGLLFGWIADRFGRIPALVGCNVVGFLAGVATAFVGSFWEFALCRFLVGFAFDNCFTMMYILVLEYVGPKWRTFVANMSIAIFFTIASCAMPWIAYYLANWKLFTIATSVPLILAVFTPFVVPESARWLVSQGRIEKAITILKKFERVNNSYIPPQVYNDFSESCVRLQEEEDATRSYSILDLFRTPRLRKITILLIIIWMSISLVFDGHVRNVGSLGLDLFFTFTLASATELPADTFLTLTLDRWGRRWLACGTMVMSGVFSLLATTVPTGPISATLAIIGRFCVNISYNIGLQYAAELLPTVVRAQGVAFIHIMGYVASIVAPFIVYLANISPSLPLVVLGCIGIFGGLLSLLLPETLGNELPQTLNDGENFGRGQRLWDFPCCGRKTIEDDVDLSKSSPMKATTIATAVNGKTSNNTFIRGTARGASLRASTRGELRSSLLRRSVRGKQEQNYA